MRRKKTFFFLLGSAALAALAFAPFFGMKVLSPALLFAGGGLDNEILWRLRVPRVFLTFSVGAGLSASGLAFQAMFKNPLATPVTLGVSTGASLGAVLSIYLGVGASFLGVAGISLFAFFGALGSILLVYGITRLARSDDGSAMLLAGVAVSLFFSSVIMFLQHVSNFTDAFHMVHWLMGGVETSGFAEFYSVLPFVAAGGLIILGLTRELNLMAVGEEVALSRGVDVARARKKLFFAASFMVGGIVAVCGPIGFVDLMVPHICRAWTGPEHRRLAPAALLFGGVFLVLCDLFARTAAAPSEMPVGIVTAFLGGPFFLWLLVFRSRQRGSA